MARFAGCLCGVLLALVPCSAAEPAKTAPVEKVVLDTWDITYLDGQRAGYNHMIVRESEVDGKKVFKSTIEMHLTVRRFNDTAKLEMSSGTTELADGKVLGVSMTQSLGKTQTMELTGTVEDDQLHVKVSGGMKMDKKIKWNADVIGLYREIKIFEAKKVKPGDTVTYLHYEPTVNSVVNVQVAVKEMEEVEIDHVKQKLLRVEEQPDKIGGVQLPVTVFWLDENLAAIRFQTEMPGLGKLVGVRGTERAALSPVTPAQITDIGLTQLIPLNRKITNAHDTRSVVYKVNLPGDDEPATALATDARQEVKNAKGKSFELHIHALRSPKLVKEPAKVDEEFLKSNYFINSADEQVRKLAKGAVGAEKDAWKKALLIEGWVNKNMKSTNFSEGMATADHVARTLEGDCTEYAMLAAAMCRAVGIPSRTAMGLVYAEDVNRGKVRGPVLAYHMWTEVYVEGQWLAIDATLGKGGIGGGHVKITDHSWYEQRSLAPMLPVMRFMMGKPTMEVGEVE